MDPEEDKDRIISDLERYINRRQSKLTQSQNPEHYNPSYITRDHYDYIFEDQIESDIPGFFSDDTGIVSYSPKQEKDKAESKRRKKQVEAAQKFADRIAREYEDDGLKLKEILNSSISRSLYYRNIPRYRDFSTEQSEAKHNVLLRDITRVLEIAFTDSFMELFYGYGESVFDRASMARLVEFAKEIRDLRAEVGRHHKKENSIESALLYDSIALEQYSIMASYQEEEEGREEDKGRSISIRFLESFRKSSLKELRYQMKQTNDIIDTIALSKTYIPDIIHPIVKTLEYTCYSERGLQLLGIPGMMAMRTISGALRDFYNRSSSYSVLRKDSLEEREMYLKLVERIIHAIVICVVFSSISSEPGLYYEWDSLSSLNTVAFRERIAEMHREISPVSIEDTKNRETLETYAKKIIDSEEYLYTENATHIENMKNCVPVSPPYWLFEYRYHIKNVAEADISGTERVRDKDLATVCEFAAFHSTGKSLGEWIAQNDGEYYEEEIREDPMRPDVFVLKMLLRALNTLLFNKYTREAFSMRNSDFFEEDEDSPEKIIFNELDRLKEAPKYDPPNYEYLVLSSISNSVLKENGYGYSTVRDIKGLISNDKVQTLNLLSEEEMGLVERVVPVMYVNSSES